MPVSCHCLDNASNNEFTAFIAARCKEYVEITFAVLPALEFVKNAILESPEALGASEIIYKPLNFYFFLNKLFKILLHKALSVPELSVGIDDLFVGLKSFFATGTVHCSKGHIHGDSRQRKNMEFLVNYLYFWYKLIF